MADDDGVHRLEGSSNQVGGLVVKKKTPTFKIPQTSHLGLDKLAAAKRREKEEALRKMSFSMEDDVEEEASSSKSKPLKQERKFRASHEETPTYTGGITEEARARLMERLNSSKNKEKGVYASSKDNRSKGESSYKDRDSRRRNDNR